jgi:hypothetical protein
METNIIINSENYAKNKCFEYVGDILIYVLAIFCIYSSIT